MQTIIAKRGAHPVVLHTYAKRKARVRANAPIVQKPGRLRRLEILYAAMMNDTFGGMGVNVEGYPRLDKDMARLVEAGSLRIVRRKLGTFRGREFTGRITRLQITERGRADLLIAGFEMEGSYRHAT